MKKKKKKKKEIASFQTKPMVELLKMQYRFSVNHSVAM